ncbi:MAG TPA: PepSY domain-containing protein [Abditibacteriaceae bacterium]|jgi:uncharacterized membrane protein YkoI
MQNKTRLALAATLFALVVTGTGLKVWAEEKEDDDVQIALPAEQVISSIRTAVAAKPGNVLEIESENEAGKTVCGVTVQAADGKTYEVEVDVATNKVLEIELEDGEDD